MIPNVNHSFSPRAGTKRLRFASLLATLFVFCSCQQTIVEDVDNAQMVDVNISLTDLDVLQTRATASEAKVTNITFKAIDSEGYAKATVTQTSSATDFGSLSTKLPVGTYTFVAVANTGSTASTITSTSEASIPAVENIITYSTTQTVTVSGNASQTVNMSMGKRKNATFVVKITDATPSDVAYLQIVIAPTSDAATSLDFNPATGLASSQLQYSRTAAKTATTSSTFTNWQFGDAFLLSASEASLDVTINALASDNSTVLYTRTLKNVSFKQGEITLATGTFFSSSASGSFSFDTSAETNSISLDQ